jgi:hypothetical protein
MRLVYPCTVRIRLHAFILLAVLLAFNPVTVMGNTGENPPRPSMPSAIQAGGVAGSGVAARRSGAALPAIRRVARLLKSVYVPHILQLSVVQQPGGDGSYISQDAHEATQFSLAARFGNIGLLAHNFLAGRLFTMLTVGQMVRLVYDDGEVENFVVTRILRYQALSPDSPFSNLRDLATDQLRSAGQVFAQVYTGPRHLVFQTCIASAGDLSWGRVFVIAMPAHLHSRGADPGGAPPRTGYRGGRQAV